MQVSGPCPEGKSRQDTWYSYRAGSAPSLSFHQSIPSSYSCLVKNALVADVELDIVLSLPSIVLSVATSELIKVLLSFKRVCSIPFISVTAIVCKSLLHAANSA